MGICYSTKAAEDYDGNQDEFTEGVSADNDNGYAHRTGGNENGLPEDILKPEKIPKKPRLPYRVRQFRPNSPFMPSPFRAPSPYLSKNTGQTPKRPFPPPSPAKHIQAALLRRQGKAKSKEPAASDDAPSGSASGAGVGPDAAAVVEGVDDEHSLDKSFGYSKNLAAKYELGEEIGRGHFGYTCRAKVKKGDLRGQTVAVKVITKAKMTTAIAIEDVKREVKILRALTGHPNLINFYDAYEDAANVYIVMELCEGGELLDRILSRGGKYTEEDAKAVIVQILSVVTYCHLQGVVHRDLKPENFLFKTQDEDSALKVIDFGLSDYVRPDERLNDIVGSAYYVAPEVLHRSYSIEADIWSIGVITYILLCGSRPFWARTESGIFRSVLKCEPSFDEAPWPSISPEARDFVQRLLTKDRHRRMTAAQALTHPWIRGHRSIPLDILIYRSVKTYLRSTSVRKAAMRAFAQTLSEEDIFYLQAQFFLLEPNKNGRISGDNFKSALTKNATEAMKDSRVIDMAIFIDSVQFKMDFKEFSAAAISVPQYEGLPTWQFQLEQAYQIFETEGNRVVMIEDMARELGVPASVPAHVVLRDWIRHNDGKLTFFGFTSLLKGMSPRNRPR